MKRLLLILLGGLVFFLGTAMIQEREYFTSAWFGVRPAQAAQASEEDRRAVEETLVQFHSLLGHLHASGGDPRFAERLPASGELTEEILSEIAYLKRNNLVQQSQLMRSEILEEISHGPGSVERRVKEYWVIRVFFAAGGQEAEPPRSQVLFGKYLLRQDGPSWRVQAWDLIDPPAPRPEG